MTFFSPGYVCNEFNTTWTGCSGDQKIVLAADYAECWEICNAATSPACTHFTFYPATQLRIKPYCLMLSQCGKTTSGCGECVSGQKECGAALCNQDYCCKGASVGTATATNVNECIDACNLQKHKWYSWVKNIEGCLFFDTCDTYADESECYLIF